MKVLLGKDSIRGQRVWHVCLQFQPKDIWLGIYVESLSPLRAYVCLVPCFPFHVKVVEKEEQGA